MSGQWTKGPWRAHPWGGFVTNKADDNAILHRVPHSSAWITEAYCQDDATSESLANDRLIAAAPDLAEALEYVLARVHASMIPEGAFVAAKRALARAKGETT